MKSKADKDLKITWLTTANLDIPKKIIPTGGQIYENYLRDILRKYFYLDFIRVEKSIKSSILRNIKNKYKFKQNVELLTSEINTDVLLMDTAIGSFAKVRPAQKNIMLVHHMSIENNRDLKKRIIYEYYFDRNLYKHASDIDIVVVVSKYWKSFFESKGFRNVQIIYNPFDLTKFNFSEKETEEFRVSLGLSDKPIIFINSGEKKGAEEVYNILKGIDAYLVTSGKSSNKLPLIQFNLAYKEYLKLLKISSLVIAYSQFEEGWNRVAHEAMLCRTPVIGSGRGGMKELLEEGGQIICSDKNRLKDIVLRYLENPEKLHLIGGKGYEYTKQFDLNYFEKQWVTLIWELVK